MAGADSGEKGPRRCFSFSRRSSHAAPLCALAHGRQRVRLFAERRRDRFPPQSVQVVGVSAGTVMVTPVLVPEATPEVPGQTGHGSASPRPPMPRVLGSPTLARRESARDDAHDGPRRDGPVGRSRRSCPRRGQ